MTREDWMNNFVSEFRPVFDAAGFPLPAKIRVTCGFPSTKARSLTRAVGECWSDKASSDSHFEILISPVVSEPFEVAGILVHELCHAANDGAGHKGRFVLAARKLLLEGKPTSTVIGTAFRTTFGELIDSLGDYPHATLNVNATKVTQTTRMLKASCPCCGYTVRLSKKWADLGLPDCPLDDNPLLFAD
jgi:hypothetical protein